MGLFKNIPASPQEILGRFNPLNKNWTPELKIPNEYLTSNINFDLDYNYRIANHNDDTYFMAPFTNYLFNYNNDTIWLSDLSDPIKFSLKKYGQDRILDKEDYSKLDSLSHNIVDLYFRRDFLYVLLNKPMNYDGKVYLNRYNLKGELMDSTIVNNGKLLETIFISDNKQKLMKVYLENEEWYVEEVDIE